jgi:hypothetical protein
MRPLGLRSAQSVSLASRRLGSQSGVQNSYTSGAKNGAPCRCRPGAVSLEETRAAVTPMTRNWWLLPELRRTLFVFSEVLIYLSYAAVVPPRGLPAR